MRPATSLRATPSGPWSAEPGAGVLGLLAAPAAHDGRLRKALSALPAAAVPALLESIAYHRIDGLAHHAVSRLSPDAVDPWLRSSLKRRHQRFAAATLAQGLALADVLEALDRAGVPVIVMRGLRSAESIYGDAGSRPFEDHDLLVPPADVAGAREALGRLGFAREARGLFRRGGVIVDLHVDPLGAERRPSRARIFPLPVRPLFERAVPGRVAGAPALLLSPEDDLLLLAIHLVKHSFDRLIRVADLAHLLQRQRQAIGWEALAERAGGARCTRLVAWALEAAALLGAPVPASCAPEPGAGVLETALMRRVLRLRPLPFTGEILMALAAPSLADGVRFLWDALLPAGERSGSPPAVAAIPARAVGLARQAACQLSERRPAR